MPTPEPELATAKPRTNWPLRLTYAAVALTVLFLVGSPLGVRWYAVWSAERHLAAAIAEADRIDPGWRREELEALLTPVSDAENSAPIVMRVKKLSRPDWMFDRQRPDGSRYSIPNELEDTPLGMLLSEELEKDLRDEMNKVAAAVAEARKLAHLPRGRFTEQRKGSRSTPAEDGGMAVSHAAMLLGYEAVIFLQEGDIENGLANCHAILNAGRSLGDAPEGMAWLARIGNYRKPIECLEQVLALGQLSGEQLAALQKELQSERAQPLLLSLLRASRADAMRWADQAENHILLLERQERREEELSTESEEEEDWHSLRRDFLCPRKALVAQNRARELEFANRAVEIAKLPESQHRAKFKELAADRARLNELTGFERRCTVAVRTDFSLFGGNKVGEEGLAFIVSVTNTKLDCAILSLAAERYRLDHGHWPATLDDLVPQYASAVPLDPFCGEKLLLRRRPNGIVIYSVHRDERDDGGVVYGDPDYDPGKRDLGFRLLDPRHRRKLPLPPKDEMPPPPPPPLEEILP